MHTSADAPALLAADSFRVRVHNGAAQVRSFDAHIDRFRRAVVDAYAAQEPVAAGTAGARTPAREDDGGTPATLVEATLAALYDPHPGARESVFEVMATAVDAAVTAELDAFLVRARGAIAAFGEGFPRLECWLDPVATGPGARKNAATDATGTDTTGADTTGTDTTGADTTGTDTTGADTTGTDATGAAAPQLRFEVALRPLPQLSDTLALASRVEPAAPQAQVKGPNIARYAAFNSAAGCEALLVDRSGIVREGATTSLIVWGDTSDNSGAIVACSERVASVTEATLAAAASRRLVGAKPQRSRSGAFSVEDFSVADLLRSEVWAVNALHGIRPVTSIDGQQLREPNPTRLAWFRDALDRSWEPVE